MRFLTTFVTNFVQKFITIFGDSLNLSPNLVTNFVINSSQKTLGLLPYLEGSLNYQPEKGIVTLVAFILAQFQLYPQTGRKKVPYNFISFICLPFLYYVFPNASSNVYSTCLPERMYSHTGCICLAFLHCAFLNVSSNCLPERMHSHIGCICY